eukprot:gnl/TRDRNA2_/TRDRNA2_92133_c0_seq1.p1 gnl/TRDRNA2_/TRDRNA2_92133_c0~~gnl/TRDRNA2_/TRDRNA2_92133_c0_seq1.p1  ORF type:complete len:430 (-),score=70.88 gnl/TRDRNA2_/TRDRNA2_92133_c0_seq1:180-1469(-)
MSSIDRFDPTELRCEVLRRVAQSQTLREAAFPHMRERRVAAGAGAEAGAGNPEDDLWTDLPSPAALLKRAVEFVRELCRGGSAPTAAQATAGAATAGAGAAPTSDAATTGAASTAPDAATSTAGEADRGASSSQESSATAAEPVQPQTCLAGVREYLQTQVTRMIHDAKVSLFLSFPRDSLFKDPGVEELYQRHHMQHWSPRLDWSGVALVQMLIWDLAANPSYRISLVIRFYVAFVVMVLIHKVVFVAVRGRPRHWSMSRRLLLCGFLLGRGLACHPLLADAVPDEQNQAVQQMQAAHHVRAATSLIGLGMTNLSAVLALQLHTLDTLVLCLTHGVACVWWAWLALRVPSGDAWPTLLAGHSLVACVCVWQQHEQERFERANFEQELLVARGMLLRSSDGLVRKSTEAEFNFNMHLLHRARCAEHLFL